MSGGDQKFDQYDPKLAALYRGHDNKEQTYDDWAETYDADLVAKMSYVAHIEAVDLFHQQLPDTSLKIIDVACGTGLVGEQLAKLGYQNVDGTDFSQGMIDVADALGVYRLLFRHDISRETDQQGLYDAGICVGLFAFSTPPLTDLIQVLKLVKPGGVSVVTVNGAAWEALPLKDTLYSEAEKYGFMIEGIETRGYINDQGIDCRVLLLRNPESWEE